MDKQRKLFLLSVGYELMKLWQKIMDELIKEGSAEEASQPSTKVFTLLAPRKKTGKKPVSKETRAKISAAKTEYWAKKREKAKAA